MTHGIQQFDFAAFFNAKLKERGLTVPKLSQLSGISMQDLQYLAEGDFDHLPPAPYLRGYTMRLAKILEFDPDVWWKHFETIGAVNSSGEEDRLPSNRFAISKSTRFFWIILVFGILAIYGGLRFTKILGKPILTILEPENSPHETQTNQITLRGRVENGDEVAINGEQLVVGENGAWQKEVSLEEGLNSFEISASKLLGKEIKLMRQIIYEPLQSSSTEEFNGNIESETDTTSEQESNPAEE